MRKARIDALQNYHLLKFEKDAAGVVMMTGKHLCGDPEWMNPLNIMSSYPAVGERPGVVIPLPMTAEPVVKVQLPSLCLNIARYRRICSCRR